MLSFEATQAFESESRASESLSFNILPLFDSKSRDRDSSPRSRGAVSPSLRINLCAAGTIATSSRATSTLFEIQMTLEKLGIASDATLQRALERFADLAAAKAMRRNSTRRRRNFDSRR